MTARRGRPPGPTEPRCVALFRRRRPSRPPEQRGADRVHPVSGRPLTTTPEVRTVVAAGRIPDAHGWGV
jgi:hypothetical protein